MSCELCDTIDWKEGETHRIVECNTCHVPMLVLREHRQFTAWEKLCIENSAWIGEYEPQVKANSKVRFEQCKIKDHAHCHFE